MLKRKARCHDNILTMILTLPVFTREVHPTRQNTLIGKLHTRLKLSNLNKQKKKKKNNLDWTTGAACHKTFVAWG